MRSARRRRGPSEPPVAAAAVAPTTAPIQVLNVLHGRVDKTYRTILPAAKAAAIDIVITSATCGLVQRRAATGAYNLTHNNAVVDKCLDGDCAQTRDRTQVGIVGFVRRRTGLEQHQSTASIVSG
jgi:hypothetical protein